MRTIIAGSREVIDYEVVRTAVLDAMDVGISPTVVLSGTARGVDLLGERWAEVHGLPVERFPADWSKGRWAGIARNREMAENADALIAVWDGKSRGTKNMIDTAYAQGLKVFWLRTPTDSAVQEEQDGT